MRIPHDAARHSVRAGLVRRHGHACGYELGGKNQPAGADHTLQEVAAADVRYDGLTFSGFHLRPPWRLT